MNPSTLSPPQENPVRWRPEKVFLVLALIGGSLIAILNPPFQAPDEPAHFFRAWQIGQGVWRGVIQDNQAGGFIPQGMIACAEATYPLRWKPDKKQPLADTLTLFQIPLEPQENVFYAFQTVMYSPVPYAPQAVVMAMGRVVRVRPLVLMYLGRITNLFCWSLMIYLAVALVPMGKWLMALLALTPMSLYQAASLSADATTNAWAYVILALVLRHALGHSRTSRLSQRALIAVSMMAMALCKFAYVPMALLFLLIPKVKLGSEKKYILTALVVIGLSVIMGLTWAHEVSDFMAISLLPQVDVARQASYLCQHPFHYMIILGRSLAYEFFAGTEGFIGKLGWLDTRLLLPHWLGWLMLLVIAARRSGDCQVILSRRHKGLLLGVFVLIVLLIATSQYLVWTPVANRFIWGLQGRYLIPIAPLFFFALYRQATSAKKGLSPVFLTGATVLSLVLTLVTIMVRYYG